MKLNNRMREKFIDDVMNGIPVNSNFNYEDVKQEIKAAIEALLPTEIRDVIKKYPNIINRCKVVRLKQLDYGYRNDLGHYVTKEIRVNVVDVDYGMDLDKFDLSRWVERKTLHEIEVDVRTNLEERLTDIVYSCSTLEKLKAALPELESYMPSDNTKDMKNLPVAVGNVISDMLSIGLKIPNPVIDHHQV